VGYVVGKVDSGTGFSRSTSVYLSQQDFTKPSIRFSILLPPLHKNTRRHNPGSRHAMVFLKSGSNGIVILHIFNFTARQPLVGQGLHIVEASLPHSYTLPSVEFLWTSDQPIAENST